MALYQLLPEYVHECGGYTDAGRRMNIKPQTLYNAIKADRQILIKLSNTKDYIEAYEIKPFPSHKLNKV